MAKIHEIRERANAEEHSLSAAALNFGVCSSDTEINDEFPTDASTASDLDIDDGSEEGRGGAEVGAEGGAENGAEGGDASDEDEETVLAPQQPSISPEPSPSTQNPVCLQNITFKIIRRVLSANLGIAENDPLTICKVYQFLREGIREARAAKRAMLEKAGDVQAYVDGREDDSEDSEQFAKHQQLINSFRKKAFEFHMAGENLVKQKAKFEANFSIFLDSTF